MQRKIIRFIGLVVFDIVACIIWIMLSLILINICAAKDDVLFPHETAIYLVPLVIFVMPLLFLCNFIKVFFYLLWIKLLLYILWTLWFMSTFSMYYFSTKTSFLGFLIFGIFFFLLKYLFEKIFYIED